MRRARRSRGLSIVEITVGAAITVGLLLVVGEVVHVTATTQHQIDRQDRGWSVANEALASMRTAAFASRRVYGADAEGASLFGILDLAALPPLPGTRLPTPLVAGRLAPDAIGETSGGNALFLVLEEAPLDVQATGGRYRVDLVRFVAFYLTQRPERVVQARADRVDLVRFASRALADRAGLDAIASAGDRAEVVAALRARGIDRAWAAGQPAATALFALRVDNTIDPVPVVSPTLPPAADWPPRAFLERERMTVAGNDPALRVPRFCQPVVGQPAFPSGFEVKIVGPSGGRQVLVRLALQAGTTVGGDLPVDVTKVLTVRDL